MTVTFSIYVTLFFIIFREGEARGVYRNTTHGPIKGAIATSLANNSISYYAFWGIPYAEPPLGRLRFKESIAPIPWNSVKETIGYSLKCLQIADNFNGEGLAGSEDCLTINCFEPITTRTTDKPLPVLAFIHGGNFIFGGTNSAGPDYFMEEGNVIICVIEYRVNVFGFLSTMDEHAKGNLGLKDQRLALKWISENIQEFGGDPNKVTVAGESAGAASVLYHMVNPVSQRYFHHGISQSGTTLNQWGLQLNPKEKTLKLARGLGINEADSETIIAKLQEMDPEVILNAAYNKSIVGFYLPYGSTFSPIVEIESDTAIFSESTFTLLKRGEFAKIPYISGFNTEEGAWAYDSIANGAVDINIYQNNPGLLIPVAMNLRPNTSCFNRTLAKITDFYFPERNYTDKQRWIPFMSQQIFVRGIMKTVKMMFRKLPLYVYTFSYKGKVPFDYLGGVAHFEEMQYFWYMRNPGWNNTESLQDNLTRRRVIKLWTNFATFGQPTPAKIGLLENVTWPNFDRRQHYLDIGLNLTLQKKPNNEDSKFWERIFDECGNPPYILY